MYTKYLLLFLFLNSQNCWSYLVSPYDRPRRSAPQVPVNFKDVGEPLILTRFIKSSNQIEISKARNLSFVEPLFDGSNIVSHSGFFTVDEKHNSNLFFWFIRKTGWSWEKAPLLLWLQGGPGVSSLIGLFEENGPFVFTSTGLQPREHSWTNDYNILYIDQPVGTGFSFTNSSHGYVRTQKEVADHLYEALTQFFQLFPEFVQNAFYITGESYAGKYIPAISRKIHSLKIANQTDINLKGLFMISPYTNGLETGYVNFCLQLGLIDSQTKCKMQSIEEDIESFILSERWDEAREARYDLQDQISDLSDAYTYDYTKSHSTTELTHEYTGFIQLPSTRKKIHVGNSPYEFRSEDVSEALAKEKAESVIPLVEELLDYYPVAFVGGQYDLRVAYPMVVNTLKKLKWKGADEYRNASRSKLQMRSGHRRRYQVTGYYKTAGNLKDVLIRGAGHMVPKDQPKATLDLLNKFINNKFEVTDYPERYWFTNF